MVCSSRNVAAHTFVGITALVVLLLAISESEGAHDNLVARKPRVIPMLRLKGGNAVPLRMTRSASQQDLSKPGVDRPGPADKDSRKQKIWELSKGYKATDKESIQRFGFTKRFERCDDLLILGWIAGLLFTTLSTPLHAIGTISTIAVLTRALLSLSVTTWLNRCAILRLTTSSRTQSAFAISPLSSLWVAPS